MPALIEISAQFGGRDAASLVLPHFWLLKSVVSEYPLYGFPLPELAFILRVDGEVNSYDLSGAGFLDLDKAGKYLSVDIGVTIEDRDSLEHVIADAIVASSILIQGKLYENGYEFEAERLDECLKNISESYLQRT